MGAEASAKSDAAVAMSSFISVLKSLSELVPYRQGAYTFTGSGIDRVGQRGRDGRQAGLADAAERLVVAGRGNEMRADLRRRRVDASHLVVVEVRLLDPAALEADLAKSRKADAPHNSAFELRPDAIEIDNRAAIEGDVHARDRQFAIGTDRHLDDDRGIADEAAVRRDTEAMASRQLAAPAGLARRLLDHPPQSSRVERIELRVFAVEPFIRHRRCVDEAIRADQLKEIVLRITPGCRREFCNEALDRKGVRDVGNRSKPPDPGVRLCFRVFDS